MASGSSAVLLVDDDDDVREAMTDYLRDQGYCVEAAGDYWQAIGKLRQGTFDVMVADLNLPDKDGLVLLRWCRQHQPDTAVILVTGYGSIESAVESVRAGAFDYLTKPLIDTELAMAVDRALNQRRLVIENRNLKSQLDLRFRLDHLIGHDYKMLKVFDLIESVADTRTTILITGESGTGKTVCARAIHHASGRRNGPFVEVACGVLPETLLESELFGHKAGSFTGAVSDKIGKFKQADGGTIFLDEVATASPALQVKLLRVLQDMQFEPVGSTQTQKVDARVILATNQNLSDLVEKGTFRQDLYYRINVVTIDLPSLRERIGDIPLLADHFLNTLSERTGKAAKGFTDEAMEVLQQYSWPGNVRELENAIERAIVLGKGGLIDVHDLPPVITRSAPILAATASSQGRTLKEALAEPERRLILDALEAHGWNRQQAAAALGINRTTLYKKMRRLGLELEPR